MSACRRPRTSPSAPASATAGNAITFTVTAKDVNNNTATGYTGTVHFTSSDPAAVLPANTTLTNGTGTFTVTFKTATQGVPGQTVAATDRSNGSITGVSGAVTVAAAAAAHFIVAADANVVTVESGQVQSGIAGGVGVLKITSGTATLNGPNSYTGWTSVQGGRTDRHRSVRPAERRIAGGRLDQRLWRVEAPWPAPRGVAFTSTVTAQDAYNNTVTGYAGTVQFGSSDAAAVLPENATLTGGVATFSVTLKTAGSQTIAATDTSNSAPPAPAARCKSARPPSRISR